MKLFAIPIFALAALHGVAASTDICCVAVQGGCGSAPHSDFVYPKVALAELPAPLSCCCMAPIDDCQRCDPIRH
ncbi:hypothetical protein PsYK624_143760 [Phanerochaete sordida]|uniref:Hydrophobin n=1 Tax=Phanerochaete sordida TaxID=48140 RepID=A0A9P3LKZ4_9APHY|nr:hypothetical protein PsYK624_143760 [Phanerochaete sordida]